MIAKPYANKISLPCYACIVLKRKTLYNVNSKEILLQLFEQSKLISLAQFESDFCPPQTVKSTEKYLKHPEF